MLEQRRDGVGESCSEISSTANNTSHVVIVLGDIANETLIRRHCLGTLVVDTTGSGFVQGQTATDSSPLGVAFRVVPVERILMFDCATLSGSVYTVSTSGLYQRD